MESVRNRRTFFVLVNLQRVSFHNRNCCLNFLLRFGFFLHRNNKENDSKSLPSTRISTQRSTYPNATSSISEKGATAAVFGVKMKEIVMIVNVQVRVH